MKSKISNCLIIILALTTITFFIIGIVGNSVKSTQINNLKSQLESREFTRVTVTNDYWQYTQAGQTLYGNIFFDDISAAIS